MDYGDNQGPMIRDNQIGDNAINVAVFDDAGQAKVVFGVTLSLVGLLLVERGGYRLFEKLMRVCIGVMFVTTAVTAALTAGDAWPAIAKGLVWPSIQSTTCAHCSMAFRSIR